MSAALVLKRTRDISNTTRAVFSGPPRRCIVPCSSKAQGFLTPEQLTSIMQHADLGLTGPELHLVIAEADDNADGTIDVRKSKGYFCASNHVFDLGV